MRPLRIALLAHIRHPIARPFMGGMEAHAWHLSRGLAARGHEVTLFAAGDSDAGCRLRPVIAEHYDRAMPWHLFHGTDRLNALLDDAFAGILPDLSSGAFDIVHNNTLHRFPPRLARRDRLPMLTSLHIPPFGALRRAVQDSVAPWNRFTVTSAVQRRTWWPEDGAEGGTAPAGGSTGGAPTGEERARNGQAGLPHGAPDGAHVVPNGIDTAAWPFVPEGDGTAVWAGRITPNKGAHLAIAAAQHAGLPLTLYGTIEHQDYYESEVRPHLGQQIRHGGHLDPIDLAAAVGRASVMLFTPLWNEPFGLAAIEAMACGVPVAGTDMGAVSEVVGPAGCVVPRDAPAALGRAARQAMTLDRRAVRARVEAHFSEARMLDAYEALYARCIEGVTAPAPSVVYTARELPGRSRETPGGAQGVPCPADAPVTALPV